MGRERERESSRVCGDSLSMRALHSAYTKSDVSRNILSFIEGEERRGEAALPLSSLSEVFGNDFVFSPVLSPLLVRASHVFVWPNERNGSIGARRTDGHHHLTGSATPDTEKRKEEERKGKNEGREGRHARVACQVG